MYQQHTNFPDSTCIRPIPRTLDMSEVDFAGDARGLAVVVLDEGPFKRMTVFGTDLTDDYQSLDRLPLEVILEEYLPYESRGPVATVVGQAEELPSVSGHVAASEYGIVVLYDDGFIRVYSDSRGTQPHSLRVWPPRFSHNNTSHVVAAPALPSGTTEREYCDIGMFPNGDLIVTFAQNPVVYNGKSNVLQEGYQVYDRSSGTWGGGNDRLLRDFMVAPISDV